MAITVEMRTEVSQLYVALFGRAPDGEGLGFWVGALAQGKSMADVANDMYATAPARAYYPTFMTNAEIVRSFYVNVLGREPDQEGWDFWTAAMNEPGATPGSVIVEMINVVANYDGTHPDGIESAKLYNNRVAVAQHYGEANGSIEGATSILSTVTSDPATVDAAKEAIDTGSVGGQNFVLTTSIDNIVGTAGNDTISGVLDGANSTLTSLDTIDGGAGKDTLIIQDLVGGAGIPAGLTVKNVENIDVRGAANVSINTTTWSGVERVSVTQSTDASVTAAATSDVVVSGATGAIAVNGGKNISVTDATGDKDITIGATTPGAGTITVADSNVGAASIKVNGGTDVAIVAAGSTGGGKTIEVGQTKAATGAVTVTSNHTGVAGTDVALNAINVTGGSTISVVQTADASKAATDTTGATLTQGDVTVTGGNGTTSVTVAQAQSAAEVKAVVTAVAGVTETASVKFSALEASKTLIIDLNGNGVVDAGDLEFTAAKNLTAAEVAQAFANLTNPDTQGSGVVANGVYTIAGATDFLTAWTSGPANGDTVVFTSTTPNSDVTDLQFKGTGALPTVTMKDGVAATPATSGVLGVVNGAVTIDDAATAAITTVTLDGYGTANIGTNQTLSKLETLNLSNSGSSVTAGARDAAVTVNAAGVTTLALNLNNVQGDVDLDDAGASVKTLNITTSGANSKSGLTAAAVETLAIAGDKSVDLSAGSTLTALKSVSISGAAGANLALAGLANLTAVDATGTSGAVTATLDGTKATYAGGSGVDNVTIATDVTKAVSMGAGDDRLSLTKADLAVPTVVLDGGEGTDTLVLNAGAAATLSGSVLFKAQVNGFERLELGAAGTDNNTADTVTVNLENLGFTDYVTTNGTVLDTTDAAKSDTLVLDNLASGGTVVIAAAAAGANTKQVVQIKDAAAGAADVLNLVMSSADSLNAGTLTAANVETINLTATDTNTANGINADALTLTADKATSVTVSGNANLQLTLTGSTAVTSIDGSAMTGNLTVTSLNTTSATTIKGGSGNDVLTAATGTTADVLIGGAGNDTLVANAGLSTLTGGEGNDWFVIGVASQNVNSYATITDFGAGDVLQLVGADSFASAKVTLGETAVFQDYANAAMNALDATAGNAAGWFQFGGNTYVVVDEQTTDSATFINGEDFIVKLTGLVDLSQASFNATSGTIELV